MFNAPGSTDDNAGTARHLSNNTPHSLPHLTEGMFGYSLFDPVRNQDWYYGVFDQCEQFNCPIESWHTESGPGVYEAVSTRGKVPPLTSAKSFQALKYSNITDMADKAALFK